MMAATRAWMKTPRRPLIEVNGLAFVVAVTTPILLTVLGVQRVLGMYAGGHWWVRLVGVLSLGLLVAAVEIAYLRRPVEKLR